MTLTTKLSIFCITILTCSSLLPAQALDFTAVRAEVDFSRKLQDWDGFGVNYVEVSQSLDYSTDPQEYGGFSLLSDTMVD